MMDAFLGQNVLLRCEPTHPAGSATKYSTCSRPLQAKIVVLPRCQARMQWV